MKKNSMQNDLNRCVGLRLRKASRAISQFYDRHLQQAGIRGTQYAMLQCIRHVDNITIGDLSQTLGMDQSTATRGIHVLYKMGLVAFAASPDDARKKVLALTPKGMEKIRDAEPLWKQAQKKMEKTLKSDDLDALFQRLDRLSNAVK